MTPETRDTLLRAAEIIEKGGACKHVLADNRGRHCVIGAIRDVAFGSPWASPAAASSDAEIATYSVACHHGVNGLVAWNDSRPGHCITPEVAAMLRYTAEQERWECPEVTPCAS